MSSLLRRAMESEAAKVEEKTVEMKGPLAAVYTEALNQAYAKSENPEADTPALESQAIDAMIAQSLARYTAPEEQEAAAVTVYGVSEADVSEQTVVDVVSEVAGKEDEGEFYLIIDATNPSANGENSSAPSEQFVRLGGALECIVESFGGKVFRSLAEFAQHTAR